MKSPLVLIYRNPEHSFIDDFLTENSDKLLFSYKLINNYNDLNLLFDSNYSFFLTYTKEKPNLENIIPVRFLLKWIHMFNETPDINLINEVFNVFYINVVIKLPRIALRPIFSLFTSTYNSYNKILQAYKSLQKQLFLDWEWVIMDDSPNDDHFTFLKDNLLTDKRIRLYRRAENSGNIGNVKNETVNLCRGSYVIEFDHDDELMEYTLSDSVKCFEDNNDVGFIYMNFINMTESGDRFYYGDFISKGYGSYFCEKYNNKWHFVCNTPNINNITLSHLSCCPNHPRIWRKNILIEAGNYNEYLPVCDDYEILLRTALITKMAKINKVGYIQYMNNNNNNFSLIRNEEINRLGPKFIYPVFYDTYKVDEYMQNLNAAEDDKYKYNSHVPLFMRENEYEHKYCNKIINIDNIKSIVCVFNIDSLLINKDYINSLFNKGCYDFFLLDNKMGFDNLWEFMDNYSYFKCYSLRGATKEQMYKYFRIMYKYTNTEIIIDENYYWPPYNNNLSLTDYIANIKYNKFLELSMENKLTKENALMLDLIYIKNNFTDINILAEQLIICLNKLMPDGSLIIDNVLCYYENNNYIWKLLYYILKNIELSKVEFINTLDYNLLRFTRTNVFYKLTYNEVINEINSYNYTKNFQDYINLLQKIINF